MALKDYKRTADSREMPSRIVIDLEGAITTTCANCHRRAIAMNVYEETRAAEGDEASVGIAAVVLIKATEHCPFCGHNSNGPNVIDRRFIP